MLWELCGPVCSGGLCVIRDAHLFNYFFQELALGTLMKFVQLEGAHPLEKPKWEGNYLFPRQLFKVGAQRTTLARAGRGLAEGAFGSDASSGQSLGYGAQWELS